MAKTAAKKAYLSGKDHHEAAHRRLALAHGPFSGLCWIGWELHGFREDMKEAIDDQTTAANELTPCRTVSMRFKTTSRT